MRLRVQPSPDESPLFLIKVLLKSREQGDGRVVNSVLAIVALQDNPQEFNVQSQITGITL